MLKFIHPSIEITQCEYGNGFIALDDISENTIILEEYPLILPDFTLQNVKSRSEYFVKSIKFLLENHNELFMRLAPIEPVNPSEYARFVPTFWIYKSKYFPELSEMEYWHFVLKYMRNGYGFGTDKSCILNFGTNFNHSCDPNVCFEKKDDVMSFRSSKNIKRGEQIYISYLTNLKKKDYLFRQRLLKFQYGFCCLCEKCISGK